MNEASASVIRAVLFSDNIQRQYEVKFQLRLIGQSNRNPQTGYWPLPSG
jgi:hypothetical protein